MLSERSLSQKDKYYMFPLWEVPREVKFIESRMVVVKGSGEGKGKK